MSFQKGLCYIGNLGFVRKLEECSLGICKFCTVQKLMKYNRFYISGEKTTGFDTIFPRKIVI